MTKEVFIVDLQRPWKPIKKELCPIIEGKKFMWAEDGHRHLLGGSAFFHRKGAERRKIDALMSILQSSYIKWRVPGRAKSAAWAYAKYKETGEL